MVLSFANCGVFLHFVFLSSWGSRGGLEVWAEAPPPVLAGFWQDWGLIPEPGAKGSPCMICHSSVPELWAPWTQDPKDSFLFPKEMNP